jgi:hypothetical protein
VLARRIKASASAKLFIVLSSRAKFLSNANTVVDTLGLLINLAITPADLLTCHAEAGRTDHRPRSLIVLLNRA